MFQRAHVVCAAVVYGGFYGGIVLPARGRVKSEHRARKPQWKKPVGRLDGVRTNRLPLRL